MKCVEQLWRLCIHKILVIILHTDGVAFALPDQPLVFNTSQSEDCGTLTIRNDTSAQGDRSFQLETTSEFQVSTGNTATVTIVDDDSMQIIIFFSHLFIFALCLALPPVF